MTCQDGYGVIAMVPRSPWGTELTISAFLITKSASLDLSVLWELSSP